MAKILLVEDDKSLREIYGVRLQAEGYTIISAGDGEEALAIAIKERPDLIVSDVMMPKISGFDMLDILRSTTETKTIKVIMMTALSSEDQRTRGEQLGADRYLVKSQVGIEDVVRAVHEVIGDAPTAAPAGFTAPATPTAVPTPAPVSSPPQPAPSAAPAAQPVVPAPVVAPEPAQPQQPPVMPSPAPAAEPVAPQPAPVAPEPAPAAPAPVPPAPVAEPESSMPQPTAPFSTPRPAGLADRIIEPLTHTDTDSQEPIADLMDKELGASTPEPTASPAPQPSTGLDFEETPRAASAGTPPAPTA